MLAMLTLSVLDQSPIRSGGTPAQAIRETLELAEACDRLGYHGYWLAEHHSARHLGAAVGVDEMGERERRAPVGGDRRALVAGAEPPHLGGGPAHGHRADPRERVVQVREQLTAMARAYHVDALVVVSIAHDVKARLRSYELLSEAFDLDRADQRALGATA